MKRSKKALLAASLIAGAAALTGCTARPTPAATAQPTQQATDQSATAQPATAEPTAQAEATQEPASAEDTSAPIALLVDGKEVTVGAAREDGTLLLPLTQTAEALGWAADSQQLEEETQVKRTVTLRRDESQITVNWAVSDNTARQITWQKDGLLIPVDTMITTIGDAVYVPAAFFEEAMRAIVTEGDGEVTVTTPEPSATPETQEQG